MKIRRLNVAPQSISSLPGTFRCDDESGALEFEVIRTFDGSLVMVPRRWTPSPEVHVQIEEVLAGE